MLNFELLKKDFMRMQVSQAAFFGLLVAVAAMIITIAVYLCSIKKSRGQIILYIISLFFSFNYKIELFFEREFNFFQAA